MKPTSYWLDTAQPFNRGSSNPPEGRYDVAVVGGGMTGSSAALTLPKKGARVALLEADTIGNAASGRNGGMCNNGFAQNHAVMAGKDAANALTRLSMPAPTWSRSWTGAPISTPGRISTGRRSPDISGVPGPCRSSAPTIG